MLLLNSFQKMAGLAKVFIYVSKYCHIHKNRVPGLWQKLWLPWEWGQAALNLVKHVTAHFSKAHAALDNSLYVCCNYFLSVVRNTDHGFSLWFQCSCMFSIGSWVMYKGTTMNTHCRVCFNRILSCRLPLIELVNIADKDMELEEETERRVRYNKTRTERSKERDKRGRAERINWAMNNTVAHKSFHLFLPSWRRFSLLCHPAALWLPNTRVPLGTSHNYSSYHNDLWHFTVSCKCLDSYFLSPTV